MRFLRTALGEEAPSTYMLFDVVHGRWYRARLDVQRMALEVRPGPSMNVTSIDTQRIVESVCTYGIDGQVQNVLYGVVDGGDVLIRSRTILIVVTDRGAEVVIPLWSIRNRRWHALYSGSIMPMEAEVDELAHAAGGLPTQLDHCTRGVVVLGAASVADGKLHLDVINYPLRDWLDAVRRSLLKDPRELTPEEVRTLTVHWYYWYHRALACEQAAQQVLEHLRAVGVVGRLFAENVKRQFDEIRRLVGASTPPQQTQQTQGL